MTRMAMACFCALVPIGCEVGDPGSDNHPGALVLDRPDPAVGLEGHIDLPGGEQILVASREEEAIFDGRAVPARITTIRGDQDYLAWQMNLLDEELVGTIGERPFGRPDDLADELDAAAWAPILASHTGEVLAAVSSAAELALAAGAEEWMVGHLTALSKTHGYLIALGSDAVPYVDPGCNYDESFDLTVDPDPEIGRCYVWSYASTIRPKAGCTRWYHAMLFRGDWSLLDSESCKGCTATAVESPKFVSRGATVKRRSKHWDAFYPAHYSEDTEHCF